MFEKEKFWYPSRNRPCSQIHPEAHYHELQMIILFYTAVVVIIFLCTIYFYFSLRNYINDDSAIREESICKSIQGDDFF